MALVRSTLNKSDRLKVVAEFSEFNGKPYLNIRQYAKNKSGEFVPTPAGFSIEDNEASLADAKKFLLKIVRLIDER
jgi:deoxyribose-phosphate aldolase